MPAIKARKQADGSTRYTAVVRIRRQGKVLHQEAKTFAYRSAAERWGKQREVALEDPAALVRAQLPSTKLATLIRWYIDSFQHISKWERTKQSQLLFLEKHPIGELDAVSLQSATLIDHVRSRRAKGAGPTTVSNDLTWIGVVFRAAKSVKGLPVHPEVVDEARTACRELRLIGKSRRRDRRPTTQELTKLDEYFARRDMRSRIPMRDIMWFAINSARREAEICRLEWADNHLRGRTGLVRDAKHPRYKEGNHRRFKFTAEAWEIMERQPKTSEYIFPFNPKSVCAGFTRACRILGIRDLRFHDLRHEATSRLFECGYSTRQRIARHDS
jgi:integrase